MTIKELKQMIDKLDDGVLVYHCNCNYEEDDLSFTEPEIVVAMGRRIVFYGGSEE